MSEYSIQSGTLSDIADAIRVKTGKSNTMTPLEMPSEIASIPGGGGGNVDITFKNYAKFNNSGIYLPEFKLNSDYKITVTFHQTQYKNNENIIGNSESYSYLQLTSFGSKWYTSTGSSEQASIAWTAGEHEFINNDNGYNKFDGNNISQYTPTTRNNAMICIGYRPSADTCNSYIKKFLIEKISTGEKVLELKPAIIAGSMTYTYDTIKNVSCLFDTVNEKAYLTNGTMSCVDSIPS